MLNPIDNSFCLTPSEKQDSIAITFNQLDKENKLYLVDLPPISIEDFKKAIQRCSERAFNWKTLKNLINLLNSLAQKEINFLVFLFLKRQKYKKKKRDINK